MSKSAKFVNIIVGCISVLFLSLFFYSLSKSASHPPGHMNKYYILSILGFLIFTYVLLRCSTESKIKVSLLTVSLILSIYFIEIFFSYNFKAERLKQSRPSIADHLGIDFDSRALVQIASDMRNKGVDAYPVYNPYANMEGLNVTEGFPLSFISDKITVFCNETGEFVIYKSDEHGFHNPKGLYNTDSLDYLLIGDSFTQGVCVTREKNIAGRLMNKSRKVLNLGLNNTGPLNQLAILKEYAKPLKPKAVLWFFYEGNDHEGLEFDKESSILLKYLSKDFTQDLIHKQEYIDAILIENVDKLLNEVMEQRLNLANEDMQTITEKQGEKKRSNDGSGFQISLSTLKLPQIRKRLSMLAKCDCKTDPLLKDVFREAKRVVDDWGGQLYFIYLPAFERYPDKANPCRIRFLDTGKKGVLADINELKIPVIDIQSVFDSHPDPLSMFPFRIKGHYNAKGYKLVAEYVENYIANNREED